MKNNNNRLVQKDVFRLGASKFYILFVLVSIIVPLVLAFIYDKFAGGLFNGFWGEYQEGVIDGNILVTAINPLIITIVYGFLIFQMTRQLQSRRDHAIEVGFMIFLSCIATLVMLAIVLWKILTT